MYYKIKRLTILGGLMMLVLNLTSCLKNTDSPNVSGAPGVVALSMDYSDGAVDPSSYGNSGQFNVFNRTVKFFPSTDTGYINVDVSYLGSGAAPQDIQVTLATDYPLLTSFNANSGFSGNWGSDVTQPNASDVWSIPTTVTIPKGQKSATVKIKLKSSLTLGEPYAIPIKISTTSYGTVSTNENEVIYLFQKVNKYDGIYMETGSLTDAQSVYTGRFPRYVELLTYDDNTVVMYDQSYGWYFIGTTLTSGGAAGLTPIGFRFDNTGKCTNVCSVSGGAPSSLTYGTLGTAASNQFTGQTASYSATPAFLVNFTTSSARYNYNLKFTYVGERSDAN